MDQLSYDDRRQMVEEWIEKNGITRLQRDGRLPPERKRKLTSEEKAAQTDAANDPDIVNGESEEE